MPTYEYRCQACGLEFEKVQRMVDDPLRECPSCQGVVKRLIGRGAGIIFKGSGFYQTDYRSDSYKRGAAQDKPGTGGTAAKTETKSETKTESKPSTSPSPTPKT